MQMQRILVLLLAVAVLSGVARVKVPVSLQISTDINATSVDVDFEFTDIDDLDTRLEDFCATYSVHSAARENLLAAAKQTLLQYPIRIPFILAKPTESDKHTNTEASADGEGLQSELIFEVYKDEYLSGKVAEFCHGFSIPQGFCDMLEKAAIDKYERTYQRAPKRIHNIAPDDYFQDDGNVKKVHLEKVFNKVN